MVWFDRVGVSARGRWAWDLAPSLLPNWKLPSSCLSSLVASGTHWAAVPPFVLFPRTGVHSPLISLSDSSGLAVWSVFISLQVGRVNPIIPSLLRFRLGQCRGHIPGFTQMCTWVPMLVSPNKHSSGLGTGLWPAAVTSGVPGTVLSTAHSGHSTPGGSCCPTRLGPCSVATERGGQGMARSTGLESCLPRLSLSLITLHPLSHVMLAPPSEVGGMISEL